MDNNNLKMYGGSGVATVKNYSPNWEGNNHNADTLMDNRPKANK